MRIRGADFVMFPVSDLARAARFYREVLGLPQTIYSEEGRWAEFDCGNVTLALWGDALKPGDATTSRIALAVDDVARAFAEMKRTDVRIARAPVDYGCCQALELFDPDGNTVILHHRADGTFGPA